MISISGEYIFLKVDRVVQNRYLCFFLVQIECFKRRKSAKNKTVIKAYIKQMCFTCFDFQQIKLV